MINQVENYSYKSFRNYTGPTEKFAKVNIIFGYNGRGKTSLARGLEKEFLKNKENEKKNYRLFNRNYIVDNLMLVQSENTKIKGVIANFGKKDVDVEIQIKKLENEIVDTENLTNEIKELNQRVRDEINKIHDTKKKNISIAKKPSSKSNEEVIELYNEDIKKAMKIEKDEEKLINLKGDNSIENERKKIENLHIPQISYYEESELMKIKKIFTKKYEDIEIPSSKIIQWITEGIEIHNDGDHCKFCGGNIELEKIKNTVNQYNRSEKQKDAVVLEKFENELKKYMFEIDKLLENKETIINELGQKVRECFNIIKEEKNLLEKYDDTLKKKIEDINNIASFNDSDFELIIKKINENYKIIINEKNKIIKELSEKESKINILIKGSIGLAIKEDSFIKENMIKIREKEKNLEKIKINNEKNKQMIDNLRKSKSNTKDFADFISDILSMLEMNLKLDVDNNNYIIRQTITNEILKIDDISEGEQNLLALLYFYYELFNDKEQKELKDEIKMIIIDDPISSVDDVNRMYVLELVKKIENLENSQIFIFTHVWEDFCNISYGKENKKEYKFFEIKKDEKGSRIVQTRTNETPYKHNFKEIYEFAQKNDCSELTPCEIYHYPNIMRKILEEFLGFKVKNSSPTSSNITNIRKVLCGDKPSAKDELMLGTLLNVCNILSHKASRNPDEILKAANFLMKKIEKMDKLHFDTMKQ